MDELRMAPQDRRLASRRLHFDGREWTVLYAHVAARMTLPTAGLDPVLEGRLAILTGYLSLRPFEPPVEAAETRISVKPIPTMPTILIVDDDPSVRDVMRRSLEREGYRVLVAEDGMAGARQWRAEGADLVIVDILMPEMDGIELLVQLRTKAPRLPILVISGARQTRNLDLLGDAHLLGATAVLEKPITMEELSKTVAWLLGVGGRHHSV